MSAENSVVSSLNELMRLEDERVREEEALELERKQREREEGERRRLAAVEERARVAREERAREAEARAAACVVPASVSVVEPSARLEAPTAPTPALAGERGMQRQLRRARVALLVSLMAGAGSIAATIVVMESGAARHTRELVVRFDAASEEAARERAALEHRLAESDERLRQLSIDLDLARRRPAAPVVAAARDDSRPKPSDGRVTPRGAARRNPTCDPHDPLCGDLP